MKKIVALFFVLLLAMGLFSGCAKESTDATGSQTESGTPAQSTEVASSQESTAPDSELPAVSENKEVVTNAQAPKVFIIKDAADNQEQLTYHVASCKTLEGKAAQEVSWEMVQMIGFWQCPVCNPPRYENYQNAE